MWNALASYQAGQIVLSQPPNPVVGGVVQCMYIAVSDVAAGVIPIENSDPRYVTSSWYAINPACAGTSFRLGGIVSGLNAGQQLTLQSGTGEILTVSVNGPFQFVYPVASGKAYSVTAHAQPADEICIVTGGIGQTDVNSASAVSVACDVIANPYFYNAVNGHIYKFVTVDAASSYTKIQSEANGASYLGYRGHLVAVTSESENEFLYGIISSGSVPASLDWYVSGSNAANLNQWIITDGPQAGQTISNADLSGFPAAVVGEGYVGIVPQITPSGSYSNWSIQEPNFYRSENWLILGDYPSGFWNNGAQFSPHGGYIIEFETPW
jgi:hypothetical protein